jgi:hypothetical protein
VSVSETPESLAVTDDGPPATRVYRTFPWASVLLYNGTTLAHYVLGTAGLLLGYAVWPAVALAIAIAYAVFAFGQMYVLMPLMVCPSCVYRRLQGGRCISGANLISLKVAKERDMQDFPQRAQGALCHNNLYVASLVLPLLLMLPGLVAAFSVSLLVVFLALAALLAFRVLVLFQRVACVHCAAKRSCPNARSMGIT